MRSGRFKKPDEMKPHLPTHPQTTWIWSGYSYKCCLLYSFARPMQLYVRCVVYVFFSLHIISGLSSRLLWNSKRKKKKEEETCLEAKKLLCACEPPLKDSASFWYPKGILYCLPRIWPPPFSLLVVVVSSSIHLPSLVAPSLALPNAV